jgi:hypothetical protein
MSGDRLSQTAADGGARLGLDGRGAAGPVDKKTPKVTKNE